MFGPKHKPRLFAGDDFKRLWDLFPIARQPSSSPLVEHQSSEGLLRTAQLREAIQQLVFSGGCNLACLGKMKSPGGAFPGHADQKSRL